MTAQLHSPKPLPTAAPPIGKRKGWIVVGWIVIAFVFVIGCWIRFKIASGELLWLDELHTSWAVSGSFQQMLTRSAQGNQAPLFFGLEWSLVKWLGPRELTLRLVSLVAGGLVMLLAARFVWLYTGSIAAAALTLSLIAIDYEFVRYSTEARPYALLHLASLIQAGCFWRMVEHWRRGGSADSMVTEINRSGIFWLLLSSWMVVYTHYTGVFLLTSEIAFLLVLLIGWWLSRGISKTLITQILVTLILFVIGCLPLLFQMYQAFGKPADWSSISLLKNFLGEQKINGVAWFGIPLVAVLFSVGIVSLFRRSPEQSNEDRCRQVRWLIWITAWFAIPILIIVFLKTKGGIPITLSRYMSVALIAGPIFAGGIVGVCNVRSRMIAIPIILLASFFLNLDYNPIVVEAVRHGQLPLMRTENWRAAIEAVNDNSDKAKWPLFLFGAIIEDSNALVDSDAEFQAYLQFPVRGLYALDSSQRVVFAGPTMSRQHFDARYLDKVVDQGGAWILVRHKSVITNEIANQLASTLQRRLKNSDATIEANWFGSHDNLIHLISIEIKQ